MDSTVIVFLCFVGFLPLICMGYGSTEALVEVMTASEEDGSGYESETASGVFTSVGAVARAEGDAVHFEMASLCCGTVTKPPLFPHGWVAVISLFDDDSNNDKSQFERKKRITTDGPGSESGYKPCSFVGQASRILLWGAAAIVFLSEQEEILTELDGEQQVHRPVISVLSHYARRVAQLLRIKNSRARVQIHHPQSSSLWAGDISRVTLWTTCGPVRYHGTVCSGNVHPDQIPYVTTLLKTESVLLLVIAVFIACLLKGRIGQWQSVQQEERLEVAMSELARQAVRKMQTQRYKTLHMMRFARRSPFSTSSKCSGTSRETCAICLDEYSFHQVLRVLPCKHSFHRNCVDPWLISKRTCPLCKFNILEIAHDDDPHLQ